MVKPRLRRWIVRLRENVEIVTWLTLASDQPFTRIIAVAAAVVWAALLPVSIALGEPSGFALELIARLLEYAIQTSFTVSIGAALLGRWTKLQQREQANAERYRVFQRHKDVQRELFESLRQVLAQIIDSAYRVVSSDVTDREHIEAYHLSREVARHRNGTISDPHEHPASDGPGWTAYWQASSVGKALSHHRPRQGEPLDAALVEPISDGSTLIRRARKEQSLVSSKIDEASKLLGTAVEIGLIDGDLAAEWTWVLDAREKSWRASLARRSRISQLGAHGDNRGANISHAAGDMISTSLEVVRVLWEFEMRRDEEDKRRELLLFRDIFGRGDDYNREYELFRQEWRNTMAYRERFPQP